MKTLSDKQTKELRTRLENLENEIIKSSNFRDKLRLRWIIDLLSHGFNKIVTKADTLIVDDIFTINYIKNSYKSLDADKEIWTKIIPAKLQTNKPLMFKNIVGGTTRPRDYRTFKNRLDFFEEEINLHNKPKPGQLFETESMKFNSRKAYNSDPEQVKFKIILKGLHEGKSKNQIGYAMHYPQGNSNIVGYVNKLVELKLLKRDNKTLTNLGIEFITTEMEITETKVTKIKKIN